jgi:lauroyl/myristoyl acyltransferase
MTWLTLRHPALGLRLAGPLGAVAALRPNAWRAPAAGSVRAVFGRLAAARVRRIRREVASLQFGNEALEVLIQQRGLESVLPLVTTIRAEPLLRLRETGVPIVVVGWHQGPRRAVSAALRKLGVPTLIAVFERLSKPSDESDLVRFASLQHGANSRGFMKSAYDALARGLVVGLHVDWAAAASLQVPLLGRRVRLARGAPSLARLSGARVVPVTRRFLGWRGRIEVTFHDPIDDADLDRTKGNEFDTTLLTRLAERLETEARRDPGSLRPDRFEWLLDAPPLGGWATEAGSIAPVLTPRAARKAARRRARRLAQH